MDSEEISGTEAAPGGAKATDTVLRLLWRARLGEKAGRRGPRRKVSVDQIVDAGIALADADGLASFSMRRVAERVGLSPMSLYSYVPDRSSLIGLMIDQTVGRTPLPEHTGTLRERLRALSRLLWDEYHRHPWLLDAQRHRPWIGPHVSARYEWQLCALEGCGLDDLAMDHTVSLLASHAAASAQDALRARHLEESSGTSDLEWWSANAPVLAEVMPPGAFPVSGRVGSAVGEAYQAVTNTTAVYEFGLEVILDGIETRVRRGRGGS